MSEIISHGSEGGAKLINWVGREVACPNCGCVFKITTKTQCSITGHSRKLYNGRRQKWYSLEHITCPECTFTESRLDW